MRSLPAERCLQAARGPRRRRLDRMLSSHWSGEVSPSSTLRSPVVTGASMPSRSNARPSSGTVASDSAVWWSAAATAARGPRSDELAGAPVAAALGHRGRDQVAGAREPRERLAATAVAQGERVHLGEDATGGRAREVRAAGSGGGGCEGGGVLGARGELGAGHVVGRLHGQPARLEHLAQLAPQVRVAGGQDHGRRPARSPRARGRVPPSEATARALTRSTTKADGVVPSGGTSPFEATSTALRSPTRAPISPTAAGSALQGTASTTRSTPANSTSRSARGSMRPRAPARAGSAAFSRLGAGARPARRVRQPSCTSSPARASTHGERRCPSIPRPPRPRCAAAAGRRATPTGARRRARSARSPRRPGRARAVHAREGERSAEAQVHLDRPDPPAAPGVLAAGDRDRYDGGAALERQPADALVRATERARA